MVWVIKLGGSLARSEELPRWLEVIATAGAGKVVLVPGGGPWADKVREAQKREGFDDRTAHRKALCAMEQYGAVLCATRSGLVPAVSAGAIDQIVRRRQVPVWMPYEMAMADASIPVSWDVTSDSLAAWLARQLDASMLMLVKSVTVSNSDATARELVDRGWVDARFPEFTANANFPIRTLGADESPRLQRMLKGASPH